MTGWRYVHDEDLQLLAADVMAGLVIGTWQFPKWRERCDAFPGFDGDRHWSWIASVNDAVYRSAGAAAAWAALPPFVEGWVRAVDDSGRRREPPFEPAVLEIRVLSIEQWQALAPLIGSPRSTYF